MTSAELSGFLRKNPKYQAIIERALEAEEANGTTPHWLGWEWHDVRAYPAHLVKLVIEGYVKVNFKSNSSTRYLLVDREFVRQAIKDRTD